jgi:hypothetical protein
MSSWGNFDASSNAPYWSAAAVNRAPTAAQAALLYGNTTVDAYGTGEIDGLFAVDSNEAIVDGNVGTGWVLRKTGTGSITTLTTNTGAYGANGFVTFSGGTGTAANAYMYVKTSGEVKNVAINFPGSYTVLPTTATPPTGGAQNAAITLVTAGRAGRVTEEVLAVVATFRTDNNADDATYPDSSISITSQPTSTSIFSSSANSNSATFTVATLAKPTSATTTHVWQYNNAAGSIGWTNILNGASLSVGNTTFAGNTSATLTVTPKFTNANTYVFRVTSTSTPPAGVTDATATTVTSSNASITIFAGS